MGALRNPVSRRLAGMLERWAYRSANRIVALSPGIAEGVVRTGVPSSRISVIPNSSDLDLFRNPSTPRTVVRDELGLGEDDVLVLYAGSFGRANRVDYLVRVAKASLDATPRLQFLLVGSGSEFEQVRQLAQEEGVLGRNLEIRPSLPKAALVSLFGAADVVTSVFAPIPELRHNSANKFFDGLAAGRPVAINYEGWQADLLRETGAGTVLDADPEVGARQLLEFTSDPDQLEAAGANALELARGRFSRDDHAQQLEEILDAQVRESSPRRVRAARLRPGASKGDLKRRVVVLDLLSVVPFYDERLVAALRRIDPSVRLVAASPHRDPGFFADRGIPSRGMIVDWASRLPDSVLRKVWLRRLARVAEYHVNLLVLGMRFSLRPPDVVHSQWMPLVGVSPIDLWFVGVLRWRGVPFVHTVHNVLPHDVDDDTTRRSHARLYRSASALICHTEEAAGSSGRRVRRSRVAYLCDPPRSTLRHRDGATARRRRGDVRR